MPPPRPSGEVGRLMMSMPGWCPPGGCMCCCCGRSPPWKGSGDPKRLLLLAVTRCSLGCALPKRMHGHQTVAPTRQSYSAPTCLCSMLVCMTVRTSAGQQLWEVAKAHRSLPEWDPVSRPGLMGELRSHPLLRGGLRGSSLVRLKGGSCTRDWPVNQPPLTGWWRQSWQYQLPNKLTSG